MLYFEIKHSSRSIGMSRESMELCELAEEQGKLDNVSQNDLSSRSSLVTRECTCTQNVNQEHN